MCSVFLFKTPEKTKEAGSGEKSDQRERSRSNGPGIKYLSLDKSDKLVGQSSNKGDGREATQRKCKARLLNRLSMHLLKQIIEQFCK